jgi:type I restriction enzyme S subunit
LKETEIGRIPQSWRLKELREVADIAYGVQAAVAHLLDESKGVPILTNVNITNEGNLNLSTLRYYEVSPIKREHLILKKGDVLLNWRSGSSKHVGKTAFFNLDGEYTFSSFILRFRVKDEVNTLLTK